MSAAATAVLTGVTGGWGRAVLDLFCERGWNVVVTYRGEADELPAGVLGMEADLTDPVSAEAVVSAAVERFGAGGRLGQYRRGLRAGGPSRKRHWTSSGNDGDQLRNRPEHDPGGAAGMKQGGRGSIVYCGASAATTPFSGGAAYALSKIAVRGLMKVVNVENRTAGIRSNELVLKIVDTPRNREENPNADFSRWSTGAELAETIEWLCSDASAPLSGGSIPAYGRVVDGADEPSYLLDNLTAAVSPAGGGAPLRAADLGRVELHQPAAIAVVEGRLAAVGAPAEVRAEYSGLEVMDGRGPGRPSGPDRLPHPPGIRGQSGERVRPARPGRRLRAHPR